jgi:hypothetical protein
MQLSPAHRRFHVVDQQVGPMIVKLGLNAAIAWGPVREMERVPLWGQQSIAGDTVGTAFVLPLLTCLIVSAVVTRQVARGHLARIENASRSSIVDSLGVRRPVVRGALLGCIAIGLTAVPVIAWLALRGPSEMTFGSFVWFKALFATALGMLVTPLLGWVALVVASRDRQAFDRKAA